MSQDPDIPAILVQGVSREFKKNGKAFLALDSVDLTVHRGELFGLLGPNGAGKTTLIKILTTLLLPTSGVASVAGFSVEGDEELVRRRINMVSGGESSGYGLLTLEENLWMFSQFYGLPGKVAMTRIGEMLERLELSDQRRTRVSDLSTGMRQKMNIIRGLVTEPEVLFLDEPTIGLDVQAARTTRTFLKEWMETRPDRTVLLTTHYMFEADEMCHRVAVIDRGRILACDTPRALKERLGRQVSLIVRVDRLPGDDGPRPSGLASLTSSSVTGEDAFELQLALESDAATAGALRWILEQGIEVRSLSKKERTLEDVFLSLVGRGLEE